MVKKTKMPVKKNGVKGKTIDSKKTKVVVKPIAKENKKLVKNSKPKADEKKVMDESSQIKELDELKNGINDSQVSNGSKGEIKLLENPLIWIDLEMTGLDIKKDQIIEIAVIVTDGTLKTII